MDESITQGESITEELSPFDKGKNDELIEILKRMKDCKDIMAFSQLDKRSNYVQNQSQRIKKRRQI